MAPALALVMEVCTMVSNETLSAGYSQWADEVIDEVVAGLPEEEIMRHRPSTFGNLLHSLGHGYAVAAIFQGHLESKPHGYTVRRVADTTTFCQLRAMQRDMDAW